MDKPKDCTTCRFHRFEPVGDSGIHLCTVRHALPDDPDDERTPSERDESERTFLGWDCDAARRMGELCGPAGKMYSAMPMVELTTKALRKLASQVIAREIQGSGFVRPSVEALCWVRSNCIERLRLGDRAAIRSFGVFSFAVSDELGISHAAARRRLKKAEAEGLAISSPTLGGCTRWWPVGLAAQLLALFEPASDRCRICGCTDTQACPGGCHWVAPNLCSAYAEAPLPFGDGE